MAVDMSKFKKKVEKKLPILFLIEESSMLFEFSCFTEDILNSCLKKNIHTEFMIVSFGLDWKLRFPKLKENETPYYVGLESVSPNYIRSTIREASESRQTFLGSALELSKAILDDPETTKPDRYRPVVIIITSRDPARGWESSFEDLLKNGRSSCAQIYWVNSPTQGVSVLKSEQSDKLGGFLKKYEKVVYEILSSPTSQLVDQIISSFEFKPFEDVPEETPAEFTTPGFNGEFGDGTEAKGDGIV